MKNFFVSITIADERTVNREINANEGYWGFTVHKITAQTEKDAIEKCIEETKISKNQEIVEIGKNKLITREISKNGTSYLYEFVARQSEET